MYFSAAKAVGELGLPQTPDGRGARGRGRVVRRARLRAGARARSAADRERGPVRLAPHAEEPLEFLLRVPVLAAVKRDALYAVYAFCRIVDDAVDLGQDKDEQRRELARWRDEIARVYGGVPAHPAGERLQAAVRTFPIPRSVLEEIISGVEMDLERTRYETFDELYPYCYRVASAVGLAASRSSATATRARGTTQ